MVMLMQNWMKLNKNLKIVIFKQNPNASNEQFETPGNLLVQITKEITL